MTDVKVLADIRKRIINARPSTTDGHYSYEAAGCISEILGILDSIVDVIDPLAKR